MKRLLEQSISTHSFLKRLGIIAIAFVLAVVFGFFISGVSIFICFLILGGITGCLSNDRKDAFINEILFGVFFVFGVNALSSTTFFNHQGWILRFFFLLIYAIIVE